MGGRGWWTVERGDLIRHVIPSGEVDAVLAAYEKKKNMPEAEEEEEQEVGKMRPSTRRWQRCCSAWPMTLRMKKSSNP